MKRYSLSMLCALVVVGPAGTANVESVNTAIYVRLDVSLKQAVLLKIPSGKFSSLEKRRPDHSTFRGEHPPPIAVDKQFFSEPKKLKLPIIDSCYWYTGETDSNGQAVLMGLQWDSDDTPYMIIGHLTTRG